MCSAGGEQNLIMLDRSTHKPNAAGTVGWAGSTFGPLTKSRLGEHEFEALMRTLDNLVRSKDRSTFAMLNYFQFSGTIQCRVLLYNAISIVNFVEWGKSLRIGQVKCCL